MADLVANGGLEFGGEGHELSGTAAIGTAKAREGTHSLEIQVLFGSGAPQVGNDTIEIETDHGIPYTLRAFVNPGSADPGGTAWTKLHVEISNDKEAWTEVWSSVGTGVDQWFLVEFATFVGTGDIIFIRFRSTGNKGGGPFYPVGYYTWHIDEISVPVPSPLLLGGNVKYSDIYDAIAFEAGDYSAPYRAGIRTWLQAIRSYIATAHQWQTAYSDRVTLKMESVTSTGLYPLIDTSDPAVVYEFIAGDRLYTVTNNRGIPYIDPNNLSKMDPDNDETGSIERWTDGGFDSQGRPQIRFHPRPVTVEDIHAPMYRMLTDVTEDETLEIDSHFGLITNWSGCWLEGLRYYLMKNNADQGTSTQWRLFDRLVKLRHQKNGITLVRGGRLRPVSYAKGTNIPQGDVSQGVTV